MTMKDGRTRNMFATLAAALLACGAWAEPTGAPSHDGFYWLSQINQASAVMVAETGIVDRKLGKVIGDAVAQVNASADTDPKLRSGDYLKVEPLLIKAGGTEVTRLHSGRSRQDIGATSRRLSQREQLLRTIAALDQVRAVLLAFAEQHRDSIVPAYTWGVQAQPVSFGHYILAYTEALERDAARLRQAFVTTNQSPLGSAALGTSSFPVDRRRLADLLGFDGVLVNSLDANQISPVDTGVDLSAASASIALTVGMFVADLQAQYRMTTPWLILTEGELTGVSSIMPQKRNPVSLQQIRILASEAIGSANTYFLDAHNVTSGMGDYKGEEPEEALGKASAMLRELAAVIPQLRFNAQRALDEVNADYSVTTELADTLQREANVPFRVGHHFASDLVTFGRSHNLRPADVRYGDAQRIYRDAASSFGLGGVFPLSERRFRQVMTAENMVAASRGLGGPQPAEVNRMLAAQRERLDRDRDWLSQTNEKLEQARQRLEQAFANIRR